MKKLGFNKKGDNGDDDGNRLALFGSRSKNKSPAPSSNPYAQRTPAADPYVQDRTRPGASASSRYGLPPTSKPGYGGMNEQGNQASSASKDRYGMSESKYSGSSGGYGPTQQGDQGGYGRDRYGGGVGGTGSRYGPGGYGGLGPADPNDPNAADDNRDTLFGGARERFHERQQNAGAPPPYTSTAEDGSGTYSGSGANSGYGAYQERQLTAEEEEEEDIQATKQEIRFMKQQDVSSTRNALRLAAEAEETARGTLVRLGAQGERIHNTEKNLDLASNQNRIAEEKSRELKKLNKSMFAVHVSNPFTTEERRRARDEAIIDRHQQERLQREETRQAAFRTEQRMERTFREMSKQSEATKPKHNLAERSKYQFEADSEDDEMENEIDSNLDALHGAATRLNALARASGREIDEQNQHLERIIGKSDLVDDQIHMNKARLDRIH